jgi:hypothetical protein
VGQDFDLRLLPGGSDLFDRRNLSRFSTIVEVSQDASPLALAYIEDLPIKGIHIGIDIDVVAKPASHVRWNRLDWLHARGSM